VKKVKEKKVKKEETDDDEELPDDEDEDVVLPELPKKEKEVATPPKQQVVTLKHATTKRDPKPIRDIAPKQPLVVPKPPPKQAPPAKRETPKQIREPPKLDEDPDLFPPPLKKPKKRERAWVPQFSPGDVVFARWKATQEYYQGTIIKANHDTRTYSLRFVDGNTEEAQAEATIRLVGSERAPPAGPPKAVHTPHQVVQPQKPQQPFKFLVEPILDIEPSHPVPIHPTSRIRFLQNMQYRQFHYFIQPQFPTPTNGDIHITAFN